MPAVRNTQTLIDLRAWALAPFEAEGAARWPLDAVVKTALAAAGRSEHTRRIYLMAIGRFLIWLDEERNDSLSLPEAWRPFAACVRDGRRTAWDFGETPAAVLWLVNASALDH